MRKQEKWRVHRVRSRAAEILAHKQLRTPFKELQKELGLEDIGYDSFRRQVRRIWNEASDNPSATASPGQPPADDPASPPAPPASPGELRKRRQFGVVRIGGNKLDLSPDSWKKSPNVRPRRGSPWRSTAFLRNAD